MARLRYACLPCFAWSHAARQPSKAATHMCQIHMHHILHQIFKARCANTVCARLCQTSFFAFLQLQELSMHNTARTSRCFFSRLKYIVGNILARAAALLVNFNFHVTPISSRAHTHPSHSQTSRLLFTSLSLGIPLPRYT
jgi:hypothetical protein